MSEPQLALRSHSPRAQHATRLSNVEHERGHGPDRAMKQAVLRFLRGELAPTPQVLVGLHRIFVAPGVVKRLLDASKVGAPLAKHVSPRLEDPRLVVEDPAFGWAAPADPMIKELDAMRRDILRHVQSEQAEQAAMLGWRKEDRTTAAVVGVAERFGHEQPPDLDLWDAALGPLGKAWAALHAGAHPDPRRAEAELATAVTAFSACHERFATYRKRTAEGAELAVERLKRVKLACDTIQVALGAGVGAAGLATLRMGFFAALKAGGTNVLGGVVGSAVAGGGSALVEGVAQHAMAMHVGVATDFDVAGLLADTAQAAAVNAANALLGGVLAKPFANALGSIVMNRLPATFVLEQMEKLVLPGTEAMVAHFGSVRYLGSVVGNGVSSLLTSTVDAVIAKLRKDESVRTAEGFVHMVADELVANIGVNAFMTAVAMKR